MNIIANLRQAVIFSALIFLADAASGPYAAEARPGRRDNGLQFNQPPASSPYKVNASQHFMGRFDARDHTRRVPNPIQQAKPSVFLDMRHQVEVDMEVWHGSTGLKLTW